MITQKLMSPVDINNSFTFSRPSTAFTPDGRLVQANNARYEAGPTGFGNGIRLEEATTNLTPSNIQSYAYADWSSGTGATTQDGLTPWGTPYRAIIPAPTSSTNIVLESPTFTLSSPAGMTLTGSFAYLVTGGSDTLYVGLRSTDSVYYQNSTNAQLVKIVDLPGGWKRVYFTFPQIPTTYTGASTFNFIPRFTSNTTTVYFADPQLEAKSYPTTFIPTTRSADSLTLANTYLGPTVGSVEMFVTMNIPSSQPPSGVHSSLWSVRGSTFGAYIPNGSQNAIQFAVGAWSSSNIGATISWNAGDVLYIVCTWNMPNGNLYVYNLTQGTSSLTAATTTGVTPTFSNPIYVGTADTSSFNGYPDVLIHDMRFSSIARTSTEISNNYSSNAPLPVDANTTLKLNFDSPDAVRGAKSLNLGAI